jgi:hypothetical protein
VPDRVEAIVTAFAKGLMLAILETDAREAETPSVVHHATGRRRSRKGAASAISDVPVFSEPPVPETPLFPSQQRSEIEQAWLEHQARQALREEEAVPEIDLEQVFSASRLSQEERAAAQTQPGPGETEAQTWLEMNG